MVQTPEAFLRRLQDRLDPVDSSSALPMRGDGDLNGAPSPSGRDLRPAAVIAPLLLHDGPPRFLFTERAAHLSQHAGQVSFPGGRVDPTDLTPADAAVRELKEEVGIDPLYVDMVGRFDSYETVTGYEVQPFVGIVRPGYRLSIDPNEVALTFETPVDFLMNPANHERHSRTWQGRERHFYAMPWNGHYIWGATAGMLKSLYDRLYG